MEAHLQAAHQSRGESGATAGLRLVTGPERSMVEPSGSPALQLRTLEVYVSAFRSFRAVGRFQEALQALPEVRMVQLRGLQAGTLQLRIQCTSTHDLLAGLQESFYVPVRLVAREAHQIELRIEESAEDEWTEQGLRA